MYFLNYLKTLARYEFSRLKAGAPLQAIWVINEECNLKCHFCNFWKGIYRQGDKKILTTSEVKNIIYKISRLKIPYLLLTGGEPFLRDDMLEILEYAVTKIDCIRVQTNATLIEEETAQQIVKKQLLDEIWISLDGIGLTHDRIREREGVFQKVITALEKINYFKRQYRTCFPHIIIHTVVNKDNLDELKQILDICLKNKAREWFLSYLTDISNEKLEATKKVLKHNNFCSLQMKSGISSSIRMGKLSSSLLKRIALAKRQGLNVFVDPLLKEGAPAGRPRKRCLLLWASTMISPYGDVLICPMLDRYVVGNLLEDDLMNLWNSDKFKNIRRLIAKKAVPICEECCVQRRTIWRQLKDPENFERVFIPRNIRKMFYRL